jgi:uncharacterized protein
MVTVKGIGPLNSPVLEATAFQSGNTTWKSKLFNDLTAPKKVTLRGIPYCFWDNGPAGEMRVWLSPNPAPAPVRGIEIAARVSVSFKSGYADIDGIADGYVPATSNPNSPRQLHFWPHKGGEEWVQYDFETAKKVSRSRVFWFDDTGRGEVKLPTYWEIQALVNGKWEKVALNRGFEFGRTLDVWNSVEFAPVSAKSFRIRLTQQSAWASGIHEWQLFED